MRRLFLCTQGIEKAVYNNSMSYLFIVPNYISWHYSQALKDITRVWTNFLWFFFNFFSIGLLAKTFFAPWKRITEGRNREGFHMEDIAEVLVTNTVMRLIGAMMRSILIIVGTLITIGVFWAGLLFYAAWILLPALLPISFVYGLVHIIA